MPCNNFVKFLLTAKQEEVIIHKLTKPCKDIINMKNNIIRSDSGILNTKSWKHCEKIVNLSDLMWLKMLSFSTERTETSILDNLYNVATILHKQK